MDISPLGLIPFDSRTVKYSVPPHLNDRCDWHDAYIAIIETMLNRLVAKTDLIEVPGYPVAYKNERERFDALKETASYWEGAIYYLCKVLRYDNALQGLLSLETSAPKHLSDKRRLFFAVWNSHGQLKWLKAFLISHFITNRNVCKHPEATIFTKSRVWPQFELSDWLAVFQREHPEYDHNYPNPYYGGGNSLHLGLIEGGKLIPD